MRGELPPRLLPAVSTHPGVTLSPCPQTGALLSGMLSVSEPWGQLHVPEPGVGVGGARSAEDGHPAEDGTKPTAFDQTNDRPGTGAENETVMVETECLRSSYALNGARCRNCRPRRGCHGLFERSHWTVRTAHGSTESMKSTCRLSGPVILTIGLPLCRACHHLHVNVAAAEVLTPSFSHLRPTHAHRLFDKTSFLSAALAHKFGINGLLPPLATCIGCTIKSCFTVLPDSPILRCLAHCPRAVFMP